MWYRPQSAWNETQLEQRKGFKIIVERERLPPLVILGGRIETVIYLSSQPFVFVIWESDFIVSQEVWRSASNILSSRRFCKFSSHGPCLFSTFYLYYTIILWKWDYFDNQGTKQSEQNESWLPCYNSIWIKIWKKSPKIGVNNKANRYCSKFDGWGRQFPSSRVIARTWLSSLDEVAIKAIIDG